MLSVMTYNIPMNKEIKKLAMAAIFLALGLLLPFVTGQIPQIGSMLLPMHIPVFLCAIIVDYKYGALIGFITPLFRSFLFSMPPMFPTAFAMAFELMTYGLVMGMRWQYSKHKCIFAMGACDGHLECDIKCKLWLDSLHHIRIYKCDTWYHLTIDTHTSDHLCLRQDALYRI